MSNREDKRAKFAAPDKGKGKQGSMKYLVMGLAVVVLLVGGFLVYRGKGAGENGYVDATQSEGAAAETSRIDAVEGNAELADGKILIPIDSVKENKLVEFAYSKDGKEVPLLAYATASGEVRAAVRMCEPCNSQSFHLEGDELVCNACGTRWKLEDLSGVSGGCLTYPPERLETTESGGKLGVSEEEVANWKPRV